MKRSLFNTLLPVGLFLLGVCDITLGVLYLQEAVKIKKGKRKIHIPTIIQGASLIGAGVLTLNLASGQVVPAISLQEFLNLEYTPNPVTHLDPDNKIRVDPVVGDIPDKSQAVDIPHPLGEHSRKGKVSSTVKEAASES